MSGMTRTPSLVSATLRAAGAVGVGVAVAASRCADEQPTSASATVSIMPASAPLSTVDFGSDTRTFPECNADIRGID